MDNENEFEIDGVRYVAVESKTPLCDGCAMLAKDGCTKSSRLPMCGKMCRADKRNVIFKTKENQ